MSTPLATSTRIAPTQVAPTKRLAGWLSAGMLDWPGRVAATLFVSGCQMRCPYCHNPSLIEPASDSCDATWSEVLGYLERRRSWVDGFVITGGEPTTDPDLIPLLERLSSAEIPVKLDTNGLRPDVLKTVMARKLVSYVALDIKAIRDGYGSLVARADAGDRVAESIALVLRSGLDHEFRTTCYPGAVQLEQLASIARELRGGQLYALQQFRPDTTLSPAARDQAPYAPLDLLEAARQCSGFIPTITRGV